jgi:hypothetical protein
MIVGGSAAGGAGVGGIMGGKKGALIGAAIGGGAASIYERPSAAKPERFGATSEGRGSNNPRPSFFVLSRRWQRMEPVSADSNGNGCGIAPPRSSGSLVIQLGLKHAIDSRTGRVHRGRRH